MYRLVLHILCLSAFTLREYYYDDFILRHQATPELQKMAGQSFFWLNSLYIVLFIAVVIDFALRLKNSPFIFPVAILAPVPLIYSFQLFYPMMISGVFILDYLAIGILLVRYYKYEKPKGENSIGVLVTTTVLFGLTAKVFFSEIMHIHWLDSIFSNFGFILNLLFVAALLPAVWDEDFKIRHLPVREVALLLLLLSLFPLITNIVQKIA